MAKKLKLLDRAALFITKIVSSMYCAIIFALLASISLPEAIKGGIATLIAWTAQTFIQLVLLSIIMVGQELQNKKAEQVAERHYQTLLRHEEKIDRLLKTVDNLLKKSKRMVQ